jgi:hypothetical protein
MSKAVPAGLRSEIQKKIWSKADQLNWLGLPDVEKAVWYSHWSKANDIGGVLAHFMDPRKVRVYIKDSLLKPYHRSRLEDALDTVISTAGLTENVAFQRAYLKPHGRMAVDGKIICWGNSRDWKDVVLAVYERAYQQPNGIPFAAVIFETGNTLDAGMRELVSTIGERLGLMQVRWVD